MISLVVLAGCGTIDKTDAGSDGGARWPEGALALGGEAPDGGFVTLPPEVQATAGSQGGFHVAVVYRVTGEALPGVRFEHRVTRTRDATLVSKGNRTVDVVPVAAGESWTTPGAVRVFLCPTPVGVSVVGEELTFEVTATKDGALLGQSSARSVFRCPPGDSFCDSICRG